MNIPPRFFGVTLVLLVGSGVAYANDTMRRFSDSNMPEKVLVLFNDCYAYAVFPTIGAGGSASVELEARVRCMCMIGSSATP